MLAKKMDDPMKLSDALRLCLLLRDTDRDRFDRACVRWLGRFALEGRGVGIRDLQVAAHGLDALRTDAEAGMQVFNELCVARCVA